MQDEAPPSSALVHHAYGKSAIRLTRVLRGPGRHELREWSVDVRLGGAFAASYTAGDNSRVVATDTIKNLVYALAQGRPPEPIESFGAALAAFFLATYPQVEAATVTLTETPWRRIVVDGQPHPHAFQGGGAEPAPIATITHDRQAGARLVAGFDGLHVLKTTRSGFVGFVRDRFTTLPETTDRILATEVQARWTYHPPPVPTALDHDATRALVLRTLLATFADHDSLSVQQTLHAMGSAVLAAVAAIDEITLVMPNKHRIPADLARFDLPNPNEVFIATDEPFGRIEGTLRRDRP